jgi:hypothetical protein
MTDIVPLEDIQTEREHAQPPANVLPSEREWKATIAVAEQIASTQFVPETYRGQPEAVVAAILTGREMGIGPMQSLRQIHMIDGRPAFAADLMLARMRAGGMVILDSESTTTRAWIHARRTDTGEEAEVEWTVEDAEAAGLLGKKNWRTYPVDMLWARCVGRLARRLGSDLLGGLVYAAEEMRDMDHDADEGFAVRAERKIDPARERLPGAIQVMNADDADALWRAVSALNPDVEWEAEAFAASESLEAKPSKDWNAAAWGRHWNRVANFNVRAWGDLTPDNIVVPSSGEIIDAFAWAFGGHVLDWPEAPEAPVSDETVQETLAVEETTGGAQKPSQRRTGGS